MSSLKSAKAGPLKETDLYPPVRDYLQSQGYCVKAEIKDCDLVAKRADEPLLIVELKIRLNLELIMQAADRLSLSESVYVAFPGSAPLWRRHWRRLRGLCQRLGIGIITLQGQPLEVNVRLDPLAYQPRGSIKRQHRLLAEFEHRVGDPNIGGINQQTIMTAYRQDALRCVGALLEGPLKLALLREATNVERAASILQNNHYGWFERVSRGIYQLSPKGLTASSQMADSIKTLLRSR